MNKVAGMKVMTGFNNMASNYQVWPGYAHCWVLIRQQERPTLSPRYGTIPRVVSQFSGERLIKLDHCRHGRGRTLVLLKQTLPLHSDLCFLKLTFLPILPFVDLQNALSTVVIVHKTLLLIKELTWHQKNWGNRPRLMEFTDLIFPTILAWQNGGMASLRLS